MEYDVNTLNKMIMGSGYLYRNKLIRVFNNHLHALQLFRMGKFRRAMNLLNTIYFVPGGEGAMSLAYKLGLGRLITRFPQLAPIPRYIEIEVTTVCDKKCIFCEHTHWEKGSQEIGHLTFDQFKHITGQLPNVRWVNLTGEGSAFLNKDYFKMLRHLRETYDTSLYLVDHLSDLDEGDLDELIGLVDGIYVSMDGATRETYERIKVGCSFDRAVHNLKYIINKKRELGQYKPDINIRCVIIKGNLHEVPAFIDLINSIATRSDIDVGMINFTGLLYFDGIKQWHVDRFPEDIVEEVRKRVNAGVFFRFEHCIDGLNPPPDKCYYWMEPYIMMGGYVLPCCSVMMSDRRPFLREHAFGNVFKQDFKEIWTSERYKAFRKTITNPFAPLPVLCAGCRGFNTRPRGKKYGIAGGI
ncbi:MAG: SPASM domain-containing protein [Deltaproteobacteria bacterium]|nr:SPASM domain-containing protein [Deltaproteobacteria bacterium]